MTRTLTAMTLALSLVGGTAGVLSAPMLVEDTARRLFIVDPQTVDEARGLAEPAHEGVDVGTAAVHDNRVDVSGLQMYDVASKRRSEAGLLHHGAAVSDDHGPATPRVELESLHYCTKHIHDRCLHEDPSAASVDAQRRSSRRQISGDER